jgi:hypothetical protein
MTDRSTTTPHPASIRAFVGRRPVAAFLIMAFAIAYPVMALPALAVHRVIPGGQLLDRLPFPRRVWLLDRAAVEIYRDKDRRLAA